MIPTLDPISTTPAQPLGATKDGWRIIGPGGGGALYIPTIKPDDPDTALVSCDMTGAYITHNGGQRWSEINFKARVGAFAFAPSKPATVYAGATGLYRSSDSGQTWELVFPAPAAVSGETFIGDHAEHAYISSDNWPGGKIEAILVDAGDERKLTIGVSCGRLALFASQDSGQTWVECAELPGTQFIKSYLDASGLSDGRRLYFLTDAGLFEFTTSTNTLTALPLPAESEFTDLSGGLLPKTGQPVLFITSPGRWQGGSFLSAVYRSVDRGQNWEMLAGGLDADLPAGQERNLNRVAACPSNANVIYLSAVEPGDGANPMPYFGIFKTEDGGQTWRWKMRIGSQQPQNRAGGWIEKDYPTTWGGAPFFLSVAPSNAEVCYATDWGSTYRSVDGGHTWQQLYCDISPDGSVSSRGLDVTNIYHICFDPFDPQHMALACTDIGAFHSVNNGKSWSHILKGVPAEWAHNCYQIVFDPEIKGKAWGAWSDCHDLPRPKMFKGGRFNRYRGGITCSENGLQSWESSSRGLPGQGGVPTDLILDPQSPAGSRTLYAALMGKGVYKSMDDGKTWQPKNTGLSGSLNAWRIMRLPDGALYLLVCRGLAGEKVIDGGLYRSADGAESWQPVALPAGVNFPNDLCFDPGQPERMYLAAWPSPIDGRERGGGLWRTEDGGSTWKNLVSDAVHVYGITIDQDHPSTVFYTTFEAGAYRSDDRGSHWTPLEGVDFKWTKQPLLAPYNPGMLYLTTFGSSVWYGPTE